MIQDRAISLNREAQEAIVAWAAVTSIIGEFTDIKTAVVPPADRRFVFQQGVPPDSWTVFVARYSGLSWAPLAYRHQGLLLVQKPSTSEPANISRLCKENFQMSTFALGAFVVQLFSSSCDDLVQDYREGMGAAGHVRLWPPTESSLDWPTGHLLDDVKIEALADDFFNFVFRQSI